jgi:hypothetical protein
MKARSCSSEPSAGSGRAPAIQRHSDRTPSLPGPVPALAEGAWNLCGSWPARGRRAVRSSFSAGTANAGTVTAGRPAPRWRAGRACLPPDAGTRRVARDDSAERRAGLPHFLPSASTRSRAAEMRSLMARRSILAAQAMTARTTSAAGPSKANPSLTDTSSTPWTRNSSITSKVSRMPERVSLSSLKT